MTKHTLGFDDTDNNVSDSAAPAINLGTTGSLQNSLYLREPGGALPMGVSMGDIHQGQIGDCFLLSVIGEEARQAVIQGGSGFFPSMIHQNADGTETVKLYNPTGFTAAGDYTFTPVSVTVNNSFYSLGVNSNPSDAAAFGKKEIWPQVIEKAYAQLEGGYNVIGSGGDPAFAMMTLTGRSAYNISPTDFSLAKLLTLSNQNDLIAFNTGQASAAYNLVENHSYCFAGQTADGKGVNLYNPWGFDQPKAVPFSAIADGSSNIAFISVGHMNVGAGHGPTQAIYNL